MFFAPFSEEEISDYIAHGPIIRVFTVFRKWGWQGGGNKHWSQRMEDGKVIHVVQCSECCF